MTAPFWADDSVTLFVGDCLEVLPQMAAGSVDAICTDPPYGLEFMGKDWDRPWARDFTGIYNGAPLPDRQLHVNPRCRTCGGYQRGTRNKCACTAPEWSDSQAAAVAVKNRGYQEWCERWAAECLRVLKPGGHMVAFGGTRTWHRLACAIEDAGFEIRDSLHWIYGSGFPKSLDVSKAIDKMAGAEREPGEPGRYASRRPRADVAAVNTYSDGVGDSGSALITKPATAAAAAAAEGWGTALKPAHEPIVLARKPLAGTVAQNVLAHGTGALNVNGCRVGDGARLNPAAGNKPGGASLMMSVAGMPQDVEAREAAGRWPPNVVLSPEAAAELDRQSGVLTSGANPERRSSDKFRDAYGEFAGQTECVAHRGADSGGASRFFPVFRYEPKAPTAERPRGEDGTAHPTVKPVDLMCWLVRLVTPPGGTVLDCFAGTGTTAEACIVEGFSSVLIEREPAYAELIRARLRKPIQPDMFGAAS